MPAGSLLRADLHDRFVPPRDLDHPAALAHEQRQRLFHIHIFPRRAREHRHQRVPVVGRRNHDRLHVSVVEQPAEVGESPTPTADQFPPLVPSSAVRVADGHACNVRLSLKIEHMTLADQPEPDEPNTDPFVRTEHTAIRHR